MDFRIGVIGTGGMGSGHISNIINKKLPGMKITALCDIDPQKMERHKARFTEEDNVQYFTDYHDLINSGLVDGVIIATPHYDHPIISIDALNAGLHVFCEKPAGVYTKKVREMNEAAKKAGKVFAVNFVMRATTTFSKIKELLDQGAIGNPRRLTWIITTWYRTQKYYNSGGWRATWGGEGGGTLLNQNPHQLDLLQWYLGGAPKRVQGFCYFGKERDVEIETEANIYMEYENGLTATFITNVIEYPGTNRLEIVGNKGKLVCENEKITLYQLEVTEEEFNATTDTAAGPIPMKVTEFDIPTNIDDCQAIMVQNWVDAATKGTPLIAPGFEGIKSLSISNAAYLSTWQNRWVDLPVDEDAFIEELNKRIETSTFVKKNITDTVVDASTTYSRS